MGKLSNVNLNDKNADEVGIIIFLNSFNCGQLNNIKLVCF